MVDQTLKVGIDARGAKKGSTEYVASINKITKSLKQLNKSTASDGTKFRKISSDLNKLSSSMKSMRGPSKSTITNFNQLIKTLRDAKIKGSFATQLSKLGAAMQGFKAPPASASKNFRSLVNALKEAKIKGSFANQLTKLGTAMKNFKAPPAAAAKNFSRLLKTLSTAKINGRTAGQLSKINAAMKGFKAPSTAQTRNLSKFFKAMSSMKGMPSFTKIANGLKRIGNAAAKATVKLSAFATALGRVKGKSFTSGVAASTAGMGRFGSSMGRATGQTKAFSGSLAGAHTIGLQFAALFGGMSMAGFITGMYNATIQSQRFRTTIGITAKSLTEQNRVIGKAKSVANAFGIDLGVVYEEFGKFSTASRLAGETQKTTNFVFTQFAGAMRVMGLGADRQKLVFLALTQMFSKGTISSEELKRQLGEQIPGAFELMQKSLRKLANDPNLDLSKLLKSGAITSKGVVLLASTIGDVFGPKFVEAMNRADTQIGRLKNSWTEFLVKVGDGDGKAMQAIRDVAFSLTNVLKGGADFDNLADTIGKGLASGIRTAGDAAMFLVKNMDTIGKVIKGLVAFKLGSIVYGWVTGIGALATSFVVATARIVTFGIATAAATARLALLGAMAVVTGVKLVAMGAMQAGKALLFLATAASRAVVHFAIMRTIGLASSLWAVAKAAVAAGAGLLKMAAVGIISGIKSVSLGLVGMLKSMSLIRLGAAATGMAMSVAFGAIGLAIAGTVAAIAYLWNETLTFGNTSVKTSDLVYQAWDELKEVFVAFGEKAGEVAVNIVSYFTGASVDSKTAFKDLFNYVIGGMIAMVDVIKTHVMAIPRFFVAMYEALKNKTTANVATDIMGGSDLWARVGEARGKDYYGAFEKSAEGFAKRAKASAEKREKEKAAAQKAANDKRIADNLAAVKKFKDEATKIGSLNIDDVIRGGKAGLSGSKHVKAAIKAADLYKDSVKALDNLLKNGIITNRQYAESLRFNKIELEKAADPYQALIRSMKEEIELKQLTGRAGEKERDFRAKTNDLLEKGIALTGKQKEELRGLIDVQSKLANPTGVQGFIAGLDDMETALGKIEENAIKGLADEITNLVVDGKADFRSLAKSILKQFVKLAINNMFKSLFGGGSKTVKVEHTGFQHLDKTIGKIMAPTEAERKVKEAQLTGPGMNGSSAYTSSGSKPAGLRGTIDPPTTETPQLGEWKATVESKLKTDAENTTLDFGSTLRGTLEPKISKAGTDLGTAVNEGVKKVDVAQPVQVNMEKGAVDAINRAFASVDMSGGVNAAMQNGMQGSANASSSFNQNRFNMSSSQGQNKGLSGAYGGVGANNFGGKSQSSGAGAKLNNLKYINSGAVRNMDLTETLENKLKLAVQEVYGKGYTANVYSGGQHEKGSGYKRVGSTRHDSGHAGDVRVTDPKGQTLRGDQLAPLGQYWQAKGYGGTGMEMRGGGIHLDEHKDRARNWNYANQGGQYTKGQAEGISAGQRGIMPNLPGAASAEGAGVGANTAGLDTLKTKIDELNTSAQTTGETVSQATEKEKQAAEQKNMTSQQSAATNQQAAQSEIQHGDAVMQAGQKANQAAPQFDQAGNSIQQAGQQAASAGQQASTATPGMSGLGGGIQSLIGTMASGKPQIGQFASAIMQMLSSLAGAGGGGGGGGGAAMGLFSTLLGAMSEGGISTSPVGSAKASMSSFAGAPSYSEGTTNTGTNGMDGIPSVLHPNEAVIPLTRGRKIPIDTGDKGMMAKERQGSGSNMTLNINGVTDMDGFKRSEKQIMAKLQAQAARISSSNN